MPAASTYLLIIYAGCCATMLYNLASAVLRAMGNSVVPLVFLILSSILNVILDVAFVSWFPMGVAGANFSHLFLLPLIGNCLSSTATSFCAFLSLFTA